MFSLKKPKQFAILVDGTCPLAYENSFTNRILCIRFQFGCTVIYSDGGGGDGGVR